MEPHICYSAVLSYTKHLVLVAFLSKLVLPEAPLLTLKHSEVLKSI